MEYLFKLLFGWLIHVTTTPKRKCRNKTDFFIVIYFILFCFVFCSYCAICPISRPDATVSLFAFLAKVIGLVINNESINEFGISFGLGIPAGGLFSNVNTTFELGQRGTTDANLVEENFINFQLSLSLNDRWFIERKYN